MKNIITITLRILIAIMLFFFAGGFYVGARYTDNKIGIDDLQNRVDSIKDEKFASDVELSRWETTMEWYREHNPKEAKKIEDWRSHNTE